jgi:predicted HicB family RNase H-like nuclease
MTTPKRPTRDREARIRALLDKSAPMTDDERQRQRENFASGSLKIDSPTARRSTTPKRPRGAPRRHPPGADGRLNVRYREQDRARWQAAADELGIRLSNWITMTLNKASKGGP